VKVEIVKYAPPEPVAPDAPPTKVSCPELVGLTQGQAEALLASLGLVGNPILEATNDVPPLRVFAQQVIPGTMLDVGTQIAFRIAKPLPPPTVTPVPNFFNRTKGDTLVLAAQAGLSISIVEVVTPSHPPHRVYSQNVPAFSNVPMGTVVTVKLSRPPAGPALVVVPELDGLFTAGDGQARGRRPRGQRGRGRHQRPPAVQGLQPVARNAGDPVARRRDRLVQGRPAAGRPEDRAPLIGLTKPRPSRRCFGAGLQANPRGLRPGQADREGVRAVAAAGHAVAPARSSPLRCRSPPRRGALRRREADRASDRDPPGRRALADVKVVVAPGKAPGIVFDQAPNVGASVMPTRPSRSACRSASARRSSSPT
jgi:hypothetical protein